MIEAAMIWNEPNNKSHWDPEIDPDWSRFAHMAKLAAAAIREVNPGSRACSAEFRRLIRTSSLL